MSNELDIRKDKSLPPVVPSHVEWWDKMIGIKVKNNFGTPGGSWINISGTPGAGKTLFCLQTLNGFAQNANVFTDYIDLESGPHTLKRYLKLVGSGNIHNIIQGKKELIVGRIDVKATELAQQNKIYVVVVDSINECYESNAEALRLATDFHKLIELHNNLILITVAHLNKKRQVAGPSQFARKSTANLMIDSIDVYRVISWTKNRITTGDCDPIKVFLKNGEGWVLSTEPDFITKNPIIKFLRKMLV